MKVTDKLTITNEDNMVLMARYPDNYFDLAIVDPPYKKEVDGLKAGFNRGTFNYEALSTPPTKEYLSELFRVSKNQILWGFNYYLELLPNTDGFVFWYKHQNGHFSEGEIAWCSMGKAKFFDRAYQKDIGNKFHPTQKPVKLYEWLLINYAQRKCTQKHTEDYRYLCSECNNGTVKILDTHLGSGSIAIACHDYGFELIACELDKEYYDASIKRIENHISQIRMF